ncbi:uncharacterized protein A1O9_09431 [Exophiala aquamarina CBS 119918]|uniref:Uncharacterized protein n=1 Tax=Exophiala aquamarina CBS 119918 TaxID=1182545 RepID=A0A072PFH2_9EURO|nr:uncharacterized protein A1O9_09431 [Exophiala aquamarina CBS 119918]KEF54265.1 hypothetical protein A1O9_09431 [Exophiala aquamarina CBS 119918]
MSMHWLGLLFACFAARSQCSELPRKQRQLTSQSAVCCLYEYLRIVNYLSHSTTVDIQTLLVLGNVIANNINAGVAWYLLGWHKHLVSIDSSRRYTLVKPFCAKRSGELEKYRSLDYQDSVLSITYNRASSSSVASSETLSKISYLECMKRLSRVGLEIVRERSFSLILRDELSLIIKHRDKLEDIMKHAVHYPREATECRSIQSYVEYWNLRLYVSYMTSELYRPTPKNRKA